MTPLQQAAQQALETLESGALLCELTAASMLRVALEAEQAQEVEPVKRWPFDETPGEFTARLQAAYEVFGGMLAAVRFVLIEEPPVLTHPAPPAATMRPPTPAEKSEFMAVGVTGKFVRVRAFNDRPTPPPAGERRTMIALLRGFGIEILGKAADMLEADAQEIEGWEEDQKENLRNQVALQEQINGLKAQQVAAPKPVPNALMADAARYQFMKSCSRVAGLDIGGWHSWTCQIMRNDIKGATLDEAIDSAIKKAGLETKTDWSAA